MSEPMKEKIFGAIEKARADGFSELKKTGKNPMFKSNYSTLQDVFDACKKPLEDNGVHISFTTEAIVLDNRVENLLVCRLYHLPSGEMLESKITCLDDTKKGSQAIGSGVTYMRRYLLQSMLNLECDPETDDDGNSTTVEPKSTMVQNEPQATAAAESGTVIGFVNTPTGEKKDVLEVKGKSHQVAVARIFVEFMGHCKSKQTLKTYVETNSEALELIGKDAELMKQVKGKTADTMKSLTQGET